MSNWNIGRRWLVIQAIPGQEFTAADSAKKLGWAPFMPYRVQKRLIRGRAGVEEKRPYLPGYLFVAAYGPNLAIYDLSKAKGVVRVLGSAGEWSMIADTDPVMRALLKMRVNPDDQTDGELEPEQSAMPIARYKKGDTVKITSGPFELHDAIVDCVAHNKSWASVWIELFGVQVLAKVADEQISVAAG
jgi:transcription antitermination factor NusG